MESGVPEAMIEILEGALFLNYFDLHCDTLYECCEMGKGLRENDLMIDQAKTSGFDRYIQFFALFCGSKPPKPIPGRRSIMDLPPEERLDALLSTAREQFLLNRDWLRLCVCEEDLQARPDCAAAFLSIEGAELLCTDEHIRRAYDAGVRMVTLSWNGRNQYACGAATDNDAGLTPRGRALVRTLVEMGVIIDVSHLSDAGFWEVCAETDAPFAATHSNSRKVCPHYRNLTDLQFLELLRRGGLVGINLYGPFLREDGRKATLADAVRHIEHFCGLGGREILAIGADFDGCDDLPEGVASAADIEKLAEALLQLNYPQSTVDGFFYENALRFIRRMLREPEYEG